MDLIISVARCKSGIWSPIFAKQDAQQLSLSSTRSSLLLLLSLENPKEGGFGGKFKNLPGMKNTKQSPERSQKGGTT